ncbi:hypothetical protein J5277_29940 [Rhizobium sp. 16-449-1b]|uniref:hypothetical protein n=1 Tax=Rhizobium sp. 16-449-1b TaxID=2819989 RepID=UPI001AD9E346|nr:hypothetical protein [Rhizobium sp. 16-449-1b]MBO9198349.1 hypothetical protein [Rhizobium sp. 16-449-1b]
MKRVQRTFTVEYKSGRRKLGTQPSSIWGNMDLKSVARAVENEGVLPPNPLADASERDAHVLPGSLRDLTCPVKETEIPTNCQAIPAAIGTEPVTYIVAPAVVEVAPSSPEQGIPNTVRHEAKLDGATNDPIGTNSARRLKKRSGGTKPIAGDDIRLRKTAKRAPRNLRAAKVELTSTSDDRAELAELETENSRLRALLAEKLRAENAILRTMLQFAAFGLPSSGMSEQKA